MARLFLIGTALALVFFLGTREEFVMRKLDFLASLTALGASSDGAELEALRSENLTLRAALEMEKEHEAFMVSPPDGGITAGVFSSYPFNFRHLLTLSRGADTGILRGAPVVFKGALVGQVSDVSSAAATVQTIYDPHWELPVRIGLSGVDAVLMGGAAPRLTLIAKDALVAAGDVVVAADPEFPFGLSVGEIGEVTSVPSAPFREATLHLPYSIQALHFVSVLRPL